MKKLTALVKWILRAWPILVPMFFGLIHWLLFSIAKHPDTNKFFAAALQVIGGAIVLFSINDNMGLFRKHGLPTAIKNYFLEFPLLKRKPISATVSAELGAAYAIGCAATISNPASSIEDRVAALEKALSELRHQIEEREKALNLRIDSVQSEARKDSEEHRRGIRELADRLERTVVGGVKLQAFGAILVAYGAVLSVYL